MTNNALQVIFWLTIGIPVYVYVGYPVLLSLFARYFSSPETKMDSSFPLPCLSLIVSAYNESAAIREKIENTLALDYPRVLLEIIVISDCSNDGTDEIIQEYATKGVRLVRLPQRSGKSAGLNQGVPKASGEILVFSDANAMYLRDALLQLVRHFVDPAVGYVVGNARYVKNDSLVPSAECEGLYWKLESWLKQRESRFGSVVGGDGAIYAIRRELFSPLQPTDINDLLNPLQIVARGYRGVYEPAAICHEEAGDSFKKEFRRKVRIVGRSLNAVWRAPIVLLPWSEPRHWFALVSHKLLRWFVPFFLLFSLVTSILLWKVPVYRIAAELQLCFYIFALGGLLIETRRSSPTVFHIPYYFCLVNLASLFGVIQFFSGSLSPTWQTIRQGQSKHDSATDLAR